MEYFAAKLKTPTTVISHTVSFLPRSTQESGLTKNRPKKRKEKRPKIKARKKK
jgi:hypothetical protein